jgi:hypothetical protein
MSCRIAALTGLAIVVAGISSAPARDRDTSGFHVGPQLSYTSGVKDVMDLYEANSGGEAKLLLPVGLAFAADYQWASGLRADIGFGPIFYLGDTSSGSYGSGLNYFEAPLTATVGYTVASSASIALYARGGVAYHIATGTYKEGSEPGLFAAGGVEFARRSAVRFYVEAAIDKSKVEFASAACSSGPSPCTVKLNTYDLTVSLGVKF